LQDPSCRSQRSRLAHLRTIVHDSPTHWSPTQHPSDAHDWPISAHPRPAPESPACPASWPPASVPDPPSGDPPDGVQLPAAAPGAITQVIPAQQSAVDVQTPAVGMQAVVAHSSCPVALGTQGFPLQQSAAVAQVLAGSRHAPTPPSVSPYARQRGTPSLSSRHARNFGV